MKLPQPIGTAMDPTPALANRLPSEYTGTDAARHQRLFRHPLINNAIPAARIGNALRLHRLAGISINGHRVPWRLTVSDLQDAVAPGDE